MARSLIPLLSPLRGRLVFPRLTPRAPFATDADSHGAGIEASDAGQAQVDIESVPEATPGFQPRAPRQPLTFGDRLKVGRSVPYRVKATCTSNNTHLVLSLLPTAEDPTADSKPTAEVVAWTTGGSVGFKKAQRGGYEAATQAALRMWEIVDDLRQGKVKQGKGRRCGSIFQRLCLRIPMRTRLC
jgi:hypothetical protein